MQKRSAQRGLQANRSGGCSSVCGRVRPWRFTASPVDLRARREDSDSRQSDRESQLPPGPRAGPAKGCRQSFEVCGGQHPAGHKDRSACAERRPCSHGESRSSGHSTLLRRHSAKFWQRPTVFIRSGGSIPIVGDFARHLGIPTIFMGFGLPDDGLHSPNEKYKIDELLHWHNDDSPLPRVVRPVVRTSCCKRSPERTRRRPKA